MLCVLLARDPAKFAGELFAQVVTVRQLIEAGSCSQRLVKEETVLRIVLIFGEGFLEVNVTLISLPFFS